MAPTLETPRVENTPIPDLKSGLKIKPLSPSGALDKYEKFNVTPVIGTEFENELQLTELLNAPNSDDLIRDLAVLVSQRGVVFFRNQELSTAKQRELGIRLGELSGKPKTSGLHKHPLTREGSVLGDDVNVIEGTLFRKLYERTKDKSQYASDGWHIDITFEAVPSDYAILKIHTVPESGGDTLWASGYEAYDRLSEEFKEFVTKLTAHHSGAKFQNFTDEKYNNGEKRPLREGDRGAPENVGFENDHPVIRTNPVTGWRSIFVNKGFVTKINGLAKDESDLVLNYLVDQIAKNHDLQVRFKWNKNDVAIWDNRSAFHTATVDYEDDRVGDRVVSLGERPYFDPTSTGRREALGLAPFYVD